MDYLSVASLVVIRIEVRVLARSFYPFARLVRQNARARQDLNYLDFARCRSHGSLISHSLIQILLLTTYRTCEQ